MMKFSIYRATKNLAGDSKKSFTLAEILIVIGIIAVVVGIAVPAFRILQPSLKLSAVSRDLISDLRYAQQLAITEQTNHGVNFLTITNEYQIIRFGPVDEVLITKALPAEVSFLEIIGLSDAQVVFNPYGAVRQAGAITLINTQNTTTTIDIRPSGFVRLIK